MTRIAFNWPSSAPPHVFCLQAKLAELGLEMDPEEFVKGLPPHIKRRVEALQELQKTRDEIEGRFKKEKAELEARYEKLYSKML